MKQVLLAGSSALDHKSTQTVNGPGVFKIIEAARVRGQRIGGCWSALRGTGNGSSITDEPVKLKDLVAVKA